MTTYPIAVIGDRDSFYGYAAVGLTINPTEDAKAAAELIRRLADNGCGIIYLTEKLAAQLPEVLAAYAARPLPALIPIPGVSGNTGVGMRNVHRSVERAVGSDILSGK